MSAQITYEWVVETVDEHGDIIDCDHYEKFPGFGYGIVGVVRSEERSFDRSWAYVKDGVLPEYFTDAYGDETVKVPKRFHNELLNFK